MKFKIKQLLTFITLVFALQFCNAQDNPIGIGLLQTNTLYRIPLYKNQDDTTPAQIIKFRQNKNGTTTFITTLKLKPYGTYQGCSHEERNKLHSMGLVGLRPLLRFRVIDSTQTAFKVITNENTNESFFIKKDPQRAYYKSEKEWRDNNCIGCPNIVYNPNWNIFETWERYLKRVEYVTKRNLKIYDKPEGDIIFENKDEKFLPFQVTEVKGDWARLAIASNRGFFEKSQNYNGWTQWKEGNNILIEITEETYH